MVTVHAVAEYAATTPYDSLRLTKTPYDFYFVYLLASPAFYNPSKFTPHPLTERERTQPSPTSSRCWGSSQPYTSVSTEYLGEGLVREQ